MFKTLLSTTQPAANRRQFIVTTVAGVSGLALVKPAAAQETKQEPKPGQKPTEQPATFVHIAADGRTTILCNRLDMGQGVETGLAMVCAEELEADWRLVRTAFGDQRPAFVDPAFGMHLTGGSNSIRHSFTQYRELGARLKAMLLAAAAQSWGVPVTELTARLGVVSGAGRTAGYGELFEAALRQPIPERVALKPVAQFSLIGKPTRLTVAAAKSNGQQRYAMDVKLPGQLTAVAVRPPVFNGRVRRFDSAAALKVPGVRAVFPIALDRGGQGVAVVATSYWQAKLGRDALTVDWDLDGLERTDSERLTAQYLALVKQPGTPAPQPELKADLSPLAGAPKKITAEFELPFLNHAPMEPLAVTVNLKPDHLDLYYGAQMAGVDVAAAAKLTGLKPEQVQIHMQMAGGGFGRRATPSGEYVREAVAVAQGLVAAGLAAPVKLVWSREDDMKAGYYRPLMVHRAEIGFDAQGRVLAWDHRVAGQSILKGTPFEPYIQGGVDSTLSEGMRGAYDIPMQLSAHQVQANVPVLWWRSVGHTHTAYVMETLIDEIAEACGQDPVAYRMRLLGKGAVRERAALQLVVEKSGYGRRKLKAGQAWGVAVHSSFGSVVAYVVVARLTGKGKERQAVLDEVHAGVHCNLCVNPLSVEAQVQGAAVMALSTTLAGSAITLKDGVVQQSNFHDYRVARMPEAPRRVAVHIVPSTEPPSGMGEPGLPPLAPALANAVARLGGGRQRALPFRYA